MSGPGLSAGGVVRISPLLLALYISGPVAIALVSWIYLAVMIGDMSVLPGMSSIMTAPSLFDPVQWIGLFVMWTVMMAAMMLPTAAPMILVYARMRTGENRAGTWGAVACFAGGYLIVWSIFSLAAAILQLGLTQYAHLLPMKMKIAPGYFAASVLVVAGAYQFTPLKQACLRQCHTPLSFLMTKWRDGNRGALQMGAHHGLFCVGCCWSLMGLLFVAGVMNTAWIIAITAFVLLEKITPPRFGLSKWAGVGLISCSVILAIF